MRNFDVVRAAQFKAATGKAKDYQKAECGSAYPAEKKTIIDNNELTEKKE